MLVKDNNITKRTLANLVGVSESCYNHYESEDDIIPLKHLIVICDYFNISLDYILGFSDVSTCDCFKRFDKKEAGKRLKEFRKEQKLTQTKLGDVLNIGQPVVANYENGKHLIATIFLYDICKKYKVSADYLLGRSDEPKYLK